MPRAFLSHSKYDKKKYVEIVARKLGYKNCVYDELTFEEGMKSAEEIEKGLDKSDIFVVFLSDTALESEWVRKELDYAYILLNDGKVKRIFPLIIDKKINYKDERIPDWLRTEYNLRLVNRPTAAASKIAQRLREISWMYHPQLKERQRIFVGRNDLIRQFEERMDSFDIDTPLCVIASGISQIGRKSLLRNCFLKANTFDETYQSPVILMSRLDSIEDFIHKTYDLGFSEDMDLTYLMHKKTDEKLDIATNIVKDVMSAKEIVIVIDEGSIVTPQRDISIWFKQILLNFKNNDRTALGVASSFRLSRMSVRGINNIFYMEVPELSKKEREGLLKRYSEFEKLELSTDDFSYFSGLLYGYPEQVYFAVDLINDYGIEKAKSKSFQIVEFNFEKVNLLLTKYEENDEAINFLCFLAEFDFISYGFIFNIVGDNDIYKEYLDEFIGSAICETLGANKEFIRVNDAIRDFVSRNRLPMPEKYKNRLKEYINAFVLDIDSINEDMASTLYFLKEALISGKEIDDKYLIPSHYLKTMAELYDRMKRYDEVVRLAYKLLENPEFLDERVKREIYYYLCLSLARLRDKRFLKEVFNIDGPDHDFLFGFYYRMTQNPIKAIERFENALLERPNFSTAKRELVQVYLLIEDFDRAYIIAKENYENNKNNPYHIQAYFHCIIKGDKFIGKHDILRTLLDALSKNKSLVAREMYLRCNAQFYAFYLNDEQRAMELINEAIYIYPEILYSKFIKFDICERFNNILGMDEVIRQIELQIDQKSYFHNMLLGLKSLYLVRKGNIEGALNLVTTIKNYPESAIRKLIQKIQRYRP